MHADVRDEQNASLLISLTKEAFFFFRLIFFLLNVASIADHEVLVAGQREEGHTVVGKTQQEAHFLMTMRAKAE